MHLIGTLVVAAGATAATSVNRPRGRAPEHRMSETPVTPSTDLMPWAGTGWSGQRVFP